MSRTILYGDRRVRSGAPNGCAYWKLRHQGLSASATTRQLQSQNGRQLRVLLRENGREFEAAPLWQRHGTGWIWELGAVEQARL